MNDPGKMETVRKERAGRRSGGEAPWRTTLVRSPVRLVVILALSIFVFEILVMVLLQFMRPFPEWAKALLDAAMLLVLVSPVIYFFVLRPLILHIGEQQRAEGDLRRAYDELELRIQERTKRLKDASDALEAEVEVRRQMEEILRRSEAEFRDLYDNAPLGYVEMDVEGRITRVNRSLLAMLGYAATELLGRHVWEFVKESDAARDAITARIGETEPVGSLERTWIGKGGTERPFLIGNRLIRDAHGKVGGMRSTMQDNSARKQAEEALRRSEDKYRKIFENVQDIFYQTDMQGRILEISPSIERYSSFSRDWLLGKQVEELYAFPEERQGLLNQLAARGEAVDYGVRLKDRAGRLIYTSVNAHFLRGDDGKPVGVEGSIRDVTERKLAEEGLLRLAAIVESADDAIIGGTLDGTITSWNPAAERILGYTAEEVKGKSITILVPPDRMQQSEEIRERIRRGEQVVNLETVRRRKDGQQICASLTMSPIKGKDGKITGVSMIARDLTEQRRTEETVRKVLVQEQRHAAAHKMLHVLMHEVSNPLTGILGNLSLLRTEELSPEVQECLNEIEQCGRRIHVTLKELAKLDLAEPAPITGVDGKETRK